MQDAEFKRQILLRLIYGEVFRHPLTRDEIQQLTPEHSAGLDEVLSELCVHNLIYEQEGFYYLFDSEQKIERRKEGSARADQHMAKALKIGRKIYRFPYVEGVAISGSLSKRVLYDDGDFDFFIITKPQRLWVARTLLILYKKIFLLNSRKHFCVNYFIDTAHLEIEEKNYFTATEMATLLPVAGEVLSSLFDSNDWVHAYSRPRQDIRTSAHPKKPWATRFITWTLNGRFGEWVDRQCLRLTLRRWKSKFKDFNPDTFELTMRSRRYISKHHPNNFQDRVLKRSEEIKTAFAQRYAPELKAAGIEL